MVADASAEPRTASAARINRARLVVVCSPKGGVGKTTIASNLLVAAGQRELQAVGVDLDAQATLYKWYKARPDGVQSFSVRHDSLANWRIISEELRRPALGPDGKRLVDLVVVDTAPSVEDHMVQVRSLLEEADLVVIPSKSSEFDLNSVIPWAKKVGSIAKRSVIVLNQINRTASSWQRAQARIVRAQLSACPVVLPNSEDVPRYLDRGLALLDVTKARGDTMERFEALFDFVAREAGL